MANTCLISMRFVADNKKNIQNVLDVIQQKGELWCGRGVILEDRPIEYDKETKKYTLTTYGETKWGVQSSLFDNAYKMQQQLITNDGNWYMHGCKKSVDLFECAKMFNVSVEYFGQESGCCFQEHGLFNADTQEQNQEVEDWEEFCVEECETKEEAEELYEETFTDEEWENADETGTIERGGIEDYGVFTI